MSTAFQRWSQYAIAIPCILLVCIFVFLHFAWEIPAREGKRIEDQLAFIFENNQWEGTAHYWFYDSRVQIESKSVNDSNICEAVLPLFGMDIDTLDLEKTKCTEESTPLLKRFLKFRTLILPKETTI